MFVCQQLVALTCIAGGVVLLFGRVAYGDGLDFLRRNLSESAEQVTGNRNLDVTALDVTFITLPLGVVLLIFGGLIVVVCILGIIAASGRFYTFTIVYVVFLSCLYFAQIVVIICAYIDRRPFDSTVKLYLKSTLQTFSDINGQDSLTLGWNAVMSYKACCGVDNYADFRIAGYPKMVTSKPNQQYTAETPQICCIDKTKAGTCDMYPNYQTMTYYNNGCYEHMWDYVTSDTGLIIFAVFFITGLEFLCLFFSVWVLCFHRSLGMSKVGSYDQHK